MRRLRALRALARVELRQLRLFRGRSLLILLLIAVPVAALVGGSTVATITTRTSDEWKAATLGRATLRVDASSAAELDAARALLADGAAFERLHSGRAEVRAPGRRLVVRSFAFEAGALSAGGLAAGLLELVDGRAPRAPDEVALSPAVLRGLGIAVGETVAFAAEGAAATVVGTVVDPEDLDLPIVLGLESATASGAPALLADVDDPADAQARLAAAAGLRATTRADLPDSDPFESLVAFVFGGFGFFEAALIIAAAFAVGLRRRQREIGLIGSIGATAAGVRSAVAVSSVVLALGGCVLGTVVGLSAARLLHPFLDDWTGRLNGPFEVSAPHVAGAFLLGLATATGASAWPARTAARLPIRVALGGRRPSPGGAGRWLVWGLALLVGGFAAMFAGAGGSGLVAGTALLGGSMSAVLGLGVASPWLLERLARRAGRLPIAWRLAVRDAGRFRGRNGPVVTAVLAGLSISLWLAAFVASIERALWRDPGLRDDVLLVEGAEAEDVARAIAIELGGLGAAPLTALHVAGELARVELSSGEDERSLDTWVACGGAGLLDVVDVVDAVAAEDDLRRGRLLVLASDGALVGGVVPIRVGERVAGELVAVRHSPSQTVRGPKLIADPSALRTPGWQAGPPPGAVLVPWLVRLDRPLDDELVLRAREIAGAAAATTIDAERLHTSPPRAFLLVVVLACLATGLVVVFVATSLSSVESAADAYTLHTVGASPTLMRGHVAARAGYLALLGGILAVPGGLIPALGLLPLANLPLEFVWPWREVLLAVVLFPALAYAGTWMAVAARGRTPRRVARD